MIQDLRQGQGHSCYFDEKNFIIRLAPIDFFTQLHTNRFKHMTRLINPMAGALITSTDCLVFVDFFSSTFFFFFILFFFSNFAFLHLLYLFVSIGTVNRYNH